MKTHSFAGKGHFPVLSLSLMSALVLVSPLFASSATWVASPADATWANSANWGGTAPGNLSSGATSTSDVGTFNTPLSGTIGGSTNPIVIDSGRTIGGINFDTNAGSYVVGSTSGNTLYLSGGGAIQILGTFNSSNTETVNAPLTLSGNYTFANNSASGTLSIGGNASGLITTGAATGTTVLTLGGSNANQNTISNISDSTNFAGGGALIGIDKTGAGKWDLTGNNNVFAGLVTIAGGTLESQSSGALDGGGGITFTGGTLQYSSADTHDYSSFIANSTSAISIDTNGQNISFGSSLASTNTGGLTKLGSGTLTLAVANTFTGATAVSAGTLLLTNSTAVQDSVLNYNNQGGTLSFGTLTAATLGGLSGAQNLPTGALTTLTLNNQAAVNSTYSGVIANGTATLALTLSGTGTQTLSGVNTYTGTTSINAGVLVIGGSGQLGSGAYAGAIAIASGSTFNYGSSASQTFSSTISGAGALQESGTGTLVLAAGEINSFTGGMTLNSGTLDLNSSKALYGTTGTANTLLINGGTLNTTGNSLALTYANSLPVTIGGSFAYSTSTGTITLTLGTSESMATDNTVTLNGTGGLTFGGVLTNTGNSVRTLTVNNGAGTGSTSALTLGGYALTGTGSTAPRNDVINGSGLVSITGVVSDGVSAGSGLTYNGTGALALSGANTLTGGITLSSGTLDVNGTAALGATGNTLTINGGTLNNTSGAAKTLTPANPVTIGGSFIYGTAAGGPGNGLVLGTGAVSMATDNTVTLNGNDVLSFGGVLTNTGDSVRTLTENNGSSTTGSTALTFGGYALTGTGSSAARNDVIKGSGIVILTGAVTDGVSAGSGLTYSGTGVLELGGTNTFTGGFTLNSGTVQLNNASALGTSTFTINGGLVDAVSAVFTNANNNAITIGGSFSASLTHSVNLGAGAVTLSGTGNTYTISTALATGTTTIGGVISGADGLTLAGPGKVSLGGANTYTGTTTVTGGTLIFGNALALQDSVLNYTSGTLTYSSTAITVGGLTGSVNLPTGLTTLTLNNQGGVSSTYSGALSSTISLVEAGSGTQVLSGTNTYTGTTKIGAGNLAVTGSLASGSAVTVGTNSATVAILSGTGTINGSVSTSTTGSNIAYIAPGLNTSGTRGDVGVAGTLTVKGALGLGSGTDLDIDLSSSATTVGGGVNDLISLTGGSGTLTFGGPLAINYNILGGSSPLTTGTYTLINGITGTPTLPTISSTGIGSLTANYTLTGGSLDVSFTAGATPTSYTLTTTVGSTLLHAGASTGLTTTLTNTGSGTADTITYSGVGASVSGTGSISGATISSPPTLANGSTSVSNTNQMLATTAGSSGTATISPTDTSLSNTNVGGTPSGSPGASTSITVYSGMGTWNTPSSAVWGTAPTASPTQWTAAGGVPGVTSGYTGVDTATFGAQTSTPITVSLAGATPNLNSITFSSPTTPYTLAQNSTGSITLSQGSGAGLPSINVTNPSSVATATTQTISAPVVLAANTSLNVAANQTLAISGAISGPGGTYSVTNSGPGTTLLSSPGGNSYTGGTSITGGKVYAQNGASGSATGTGPISISGSGLLGVTAATGSNKGSVSGAITLTSGGTLYSGGVATGTPATGTGTGAVLSSALNVNGGNLTFALNTGNVSGASVSNPNTSTSYLTASSVSFTGNDSITLVDLTNGGLSLRMNAPYLLINAGSDSAFNNTLVTESNSGVISLDGNGAVLGVWVSGNSASNYMYDPIAINQFGADGVTPLANFNAAYVTPQLYLYNGDLEVVPEPGTWALMIGGLALLIVIQRRKNMLG
jgi:fibronectin-binding autotransporter adhesin